MAKELRVVIAGDSSALQAALGRASAATQGFGASVSRIGDKISGFGKTLTTHLTLPIVGIGALSVDSAVKFQDAMERLHTQAGVAQGAIDGLSKSVLKLAGPTATAPDELAAGLYHIESQGVASSKIMDTLRIAAEGAKMGQADLEDVTNALGAVIASNIGGVKSYDQAMGMLNATVGAGDMRMQDLADAMGTGLPAKAASYGISLRDVSAALATLGDSNIRGAEAGTQLASAFRLMEAPSARAAKAMASMGISSVELSQTLATKGIVPALDLLKTKLTAFGATTHDELARALTPMFGGKQSGAVLVLLDQLDRLKSKEKAVADGGANFAKDWGAYTKTAAYHLSSMGAAMQASGVTIGTILLPVVSKLVNKIADGIKWFDGLSKSTQKVILIMAGIAAAIGPVVSIIGAMVTAVGALATAFTFLAANPIVLVIAAIALLAAGIAAAVLYPKQFEKVLEKMGLSATQAAGVVRVLREAFAYLEIGVDAAVHVIQALWARFGGNILNQARIDWNLIKALIQSTLTVIRGLINIFGGLAHGDWSRVWTGIKQVASGEWSAIKAVISAELATIRNVMSAVGHALGAIMSAVWHAIEADVSSAWHGISNAVSNAMGDLVDVVSREGSKVIDWFKGLPGRIIGALGDLGSLLYNAGASVVDGFIHGVESKFGGVMSTLHHLTSLLPSWKGPPAYDRTILSASGQLVIQGFIDGLESRYKDAQKSLKGFGNALAIDAAIRAASKYIGVKQAEAVADGFVQSTPTIEQQIKQGLTAAIASAKQAVVDSTSSFQQAFSQLANDALSAFDQKMSTWVSPAQKMLDKMQLQDQVKSAADAVTQAQDQLTQAKQALADGIAQAGDPDSATLANLAAAATQAKIALDNLKASGTASKDALKQAQSAYDQAAAAQQAFALGHPNASLKNVDIQGLTDQVTQATNAVAAAQRQQTELNLQLEAAQQQKAHDKRMARQREDLAKLLYQLQQELLKHPEEWRKMGVKVQAVLKKFGIDTMSNSGTKWADMFADGIRKGIPAAEAAAKALAAAVDKYMPHSPAKEGPLSRLPNWAALMAGLPETVTSANAAMARLAGVGVSGGYAGSAGAAYAGARPVTVNVTVNGWVGDDASLALKLRDALAREGIYQSSVFGGRA